MFTILPGLLFFVLLGVCGSVAWLIGAISVLVVGRMPSFVDDFLSRTVRYQICLLAYHLSLVEEYPTYRQAAPITAIAA